MKRFAALFLVVGLCTLPAPARAQDDQVFGTKGAPVRGRITAISPDKITLSAAGGARLFDVKDVVRVIFGGEPGELTRARPLVAESRFQDALKELTKLKPETIKEEMIRQEVAFLTGLCQARLALAGGEDKVAAITALKGFLGQNRNTYHFYEGVELLGELCLASNDFAQAATFYTLLAKAPWPEYQMRADIQLANAKCAGGNYAEALPVYEKLMTAGVTTPETAQQVLHATVGKAACLAATGKPDEGLKLIDEVIAKNDSGDARLFARAYNARGACHLKLQKPKEAILDYLRTELLYPGDAESSNELLSLIQQRSTSALINGIPWARIFGEPGEERPVAAEPEPQRARILTDADEAEVERLYQQLRTAGRFTDQEK